MNPVTVICDALVLGVIALFAWLLRDDLLRAVRWLIPDSIQARADNLIAEHHGRHALYRDHEAERLADNPTFWRAFVLAHPLDDACPDCSLWDAEGDRPVVKPCDKHKEQAQ